MRALVLALALILTAPAAAQDFAREVAAASELRTMCDADRGRLWGASLCAPLLVADPATGQVWADVPDTAGVLRVGGGGWIGQLPPGPPIANAALDWAGRRWIVLAAPLPADASDRRVLLAQAAWRGVQADLALPDQACDCTHLATEQGRYLIRLEMRALSTALRSRGRAREQAAREALLFRAARVAGAPDRAAAEAARDRSDGLAAYTGVALGARDNGAAFAARTLDRFDANDALAHAYAYATGPAYGLLLDERRPNWRSELTTGVAPAALLAASLRIPNISARALQQAASRYGGEAIAAQEASRAQALRALER